MWWLWLIVAGMILLLVWHKREGYTDESPYTMSMKQQGELERIHDLLVQYTDAKENNLLSQVALNDLMKRADQNDSYLSALQTNIAMKNMNDRKDAYPDPNNVDIKAN